MLDRFKKYLQEHRLIRGKRPVLVAVSGGADSVTLAFLLRQAGIAVALAHCNFKMRGEESDEDERFVKALARKWKVRCFTTAFQTKTFAADNRIGIQLAARQLRYDWFRKLIREEGFQAVATAHHADDLAESVLLNLVRGTGLAGYHGIQPFQKGLIRPLLFASRKEVEAYAVEQGLLWRNDSSNDTDAYTRNRIRRKVMPLLKEINPSLPASLVRHAEIMTGYEALVKKAVEEMGKKCITRSGTGITIRTEGLESGPLTEVLLYEWLKEFGFGGDVCRMLGQGIASKSVGNRYEGDGHEALIERSRVVIRKKKRHEPLPVRVIADKKTTVSTPFFRLKIAPVQLKPGTAHAQLPGFSDPHVAWIHAEHLQFPLELRPWQKGDRFRPLGMKGSKLVSDFITDLRLNNQQKEQLYLLWSGNQVVWVVGWRPDDRYKLLPETRKAVKLTLEPINT